MNGWDLKKALIQFHKGNATLFEWSNSPVVYHTTEDWRTVYHAAKPYFSVKAALYHYYGTAKNTYFQYLQGDAVKYKKYFYSLRPLLAAKYIQDNLCPPPVLFDELMKLKMPDQLRKEILKLLDLKKSSGEQEQKQPLPVIQTFIQSELEQQKEYIGKLEEDRRQEWETLNQIFLHILR